jgi:hypothetical protein
MAAPASFIRLLSGTPPLVLARQHCGNIFQRPVEYFGVAKLELGFERLYFGSWCSIVALHTNAKDFAAMWKTRDGELRAWERMRRWQAVDELIKPVTFGTVRTISAGVA